MAADYLELSWDVLQSLVLLENKQLIQVNKEQCGLLIKLFLESLSSVRDAVDSLPPQKRALVCNQRNYALQELYRVVTEVATIINTCCEDPLKATVQLQDSTEAFVQSIYDANWLAALIGIVVSDARDLTVESDLQHQQVEEIKKLAVARKSKMEWIRHVFKAAALKDHMRLTSLLELQKSARGVVDEQEEQKVAYLLKLMPTTFGGKFTLPTIEPRQLQCIKKIGGGSFGTVLEVKWLGLRCAQKVFQGIAKESFRNEVPSLAGLHHPHIVQLLGVSIDMRLRCSLVMEFMSEDLNAFIVKRTISHIDQRPFELGVAVDIMLQIAEGMQYLHEHDVVHRDLKSSNVLVNVESPKQGYILAKVTDFGLGKTKVTSANFSLQHQERANRWRAPELFGVHDSDFQKSELWTPAADVYSFGMLCYEVLTGDIPFKDVAVSDLSERIKDGIRPRLPARLPRTLSSLINTSWDAGSQRRPTFSQICATLRDIKGSLMIGSLKYCKNRWLS